jgi:hypothetical protein
MSDTSARRARPALRRASTAAALAWAAALALPGASLRGQPAPGFSNAPESRPVATGVSPLTGPALGEAEQRFQDDIKALTQYSHRLAGLRPDGLDATAMPPGGSWPASEHVEKRLRQIGIGEIYVQTFPVVQATTAQCRLFIDGNEVTGKDFFSPGDPEALLPVIYQCRPNVLQGAITPAEGITGSAVYAGNGEPNDYAVDLPEKKIVLMEWNCEKNWLKAFAFGAKAVVFLGSRDPAVKPWHHVNVPANLPRFYVPPKVAEQLRKRLEEARRARAEGGSGPGAAGPELKIVAATQWREARGRNVIAVIRGTDPKFDEKKKEKDQAFLLAAPLDSLSEVPALSPGARDAANVAALLQTAEYLSRPDRRCRRDIILAFFDAQGQNHLGARAFYGAIYRQLKGVTAKQTLDDREQNITSELDFRRKVLEVVRQAEIFDDAVQQMPRHKDAVQILRDEASGMSSSVLDELRPLRIERSDIQREVRQTEKDLAGAAPDQFKPLEEKLKQMQGRLASLEGTIGPLADEDMGWNRVEKALHDEKTLAQITADYQRQIDEAPDEPAKAKRRKELDQIARKLPLLLAHTRRLQEDRINELNQQLDENNQGKTLRGLLGPDRNTIMVHVSLCLGDAREAWTFVHGDDSAPIDDDKSGNYTAVFSTIEDAYWDRVEMKDKVVRRGMQTADLPGERRIRTERGDVESLAKDKIAGFRPGLWPDVPGFDPRAVSASYSTSSRLFAPAQFADSGAIARIFAIFNLTAATVMDRLPRHGQPMDTLAALDAHAVLAQTRQVAPFLKALGDHEGMNVANRIRPDVAYNDTEWSDNKSNGPTIKRTGAGSAMSDRPIRNAWVAVLRRSPPWGEASVQRIPPGFETAIFLKTNANGLFDVPAVSQRNYRPCYILSATFDEPSIWEANQVGRIASRGLISSVSSARTVSCTDQVDRASVSLFRAKPKTAVGYGYDRGAIATIAMRARSTSKFRDDRSLLCEWENLLTLFASDDTKGFKVFNKAGMALLDNLKAKEDYPGRGLSLDDPFDFPVTPRVMAHDFRILNEYRLDLLRDNRINPESLDVLDGKAKDLEEDALAGRGERPADALAAPEPAGGAQAASGPATRPAAAETVDAFYGGLAASTAYSRRVYTPLVGVMNDLVTAVVLLLLLAMPFAYALERLLIGTPHIYRQIGWFTLFFALTFAILYMVNPAFRIAATPIIIFLAFAIILLSTLVIFIMVRKLQTEIKRMQGLATTVHSADVSRLSTMMAAVNMGISTMRRRPLRTLLTAITVVLLTFTILTFASFGSAWGPRETYEGPMSGSPPRVLVRSQLWGAIGEGAYDVVRGHLADEAAVVPRWWVSPTAQDAQNAKNAGVTTDLLLATDDLRQITSIAAAIGLDYVDVREQDQLRDTLEGDPNALSGRCIFLTEAVRDELQGDPNKLEGAWKPLKVGDQVMLAGIRLTFAVTIRDKLAAHTMLEGSSVLPVDYHASSGGALESFTQQQSQAETLSEMPDVESAQFVSYNLDKVVIVSPQVARDMRANIRALNIYPRPGRDIRDIAHRVACISELPTYVGDQGGVYRLIFTSLARASGWRDLLVPVLLGGLIIFATMLGSVSDREKEIYTFSSLGLAPPHIASLFFAEASMYAVIGGMGGYLLGQIVARVLGYLSNLGWVSVPNMNYSSTNAIVTILIVMGTVLISTIYPAVKASRSANPGIQRHWKIPKPQANLYDLVFPFTVSAYDITGVVSFLKEHFDNFSDTALGCFATTRSSIIRQKANSMLGFRATVALAPFDLGVNQSFALLSQPSDIEGIDEVRIMICRLSGAGGDWQRSNRVFINDLRKQLLIWRSLPHEVMEKYRNKTLETWDQLPVQDVAAEALATEDGPEGAGGAA